MQKLILAKIMRYLDKVGEPVGGSRIILPAVLGRPGPSKFVLLSTLYRDSNAERYTNFLVRSVSGPQTSSHEAFAWADALASPGGVPRAHLRQRRVRCGCYIWRRGALEPQPLLSRPSIHNSPPRLVILPSLHITFFFLSFVYRKEASKKVVQCSARLGRSVLCGDASDQLGNRLIGFHNCHVEIGARIHFIECGKFLQGLDEVEKTWTKSETGIVLRFDYFEISIKILKQTIILLKH